MKVSCLSLLFCVLIVPIGHGSPRRQVPIKQANVDVGKPLILTPLIENGETKLARKMSRVHGLPGVKHLESYAGYLTINKEYNSNMFFWFFPSMAKRSAPILLWLQGGPGVSSMFGNFAELGPLKVFKNQTVVRREWTWTREFNLFFIDNPVGTGFSFTDDEKGFVTSEQQVAQDLLVALKQFFTIFDTYQKNDFYITGESYAGKYIPALAHLISKTPKVNFKLKGLAIGDGYCDPKTQNDYADILYQIGLLDQKEFKYMTDQQNKALKLLDEEKYIESYKIFDELINGDFFEGPTFFNNATGLFDYDNFLNTYMPQDLKYYKRYLNMPSVQKAIHVGGKPYHEYNQTVDKHLLLDFMRSVKPLVGELLDDNKYKVMLYNGNLDILVAAVLTEKFVSTINWSGKEKFANTKKKIWKVDPNDVAGYVRNVDKFFQVIVRNAGHLVPHDQPRISFKLISAFVNDKL